METTMSHTVLTSTPVTAGSAATTRVRDLLIQTRAVVKAWLNRREAAAMLAGMDERMLNDIGLCQGDVRSALAEPMWSDPTVRLKLLSVERRAAARAMAREALVRGPAAPSTATALAARQDAGQTSNLKAAC
jgi:uncharacterized protein YjiS (DUF1127 family)